MNIEDLKGNLYKFSVRTPTEGFVLLEGEPEEVLNRIKTDLILQFGEDGFEIISFEPMSDEEVAEIADQLIDALADTDLETEDTESEEQPDFFEQARPKYLN